MPRCVFLFMALLWVPMVAHCRIASLPGFEFLSCADHGHCESEPSKSSCEDRGCCVQETGGYQTARWEDEDLAPDVRPHLVPPELPELGGAGIVAPVVDEFRGILTAAPPPVVSKSSWIFRLRLALPVRAPSLAS